MLAMAVRRVVLPLPATELTNVGNDGYDLMWSTISCCSCVRFNGIP